METDPKDEHSYEAYMDATDFFYEEGRPLDGNRFFEDIDNLRGQNSACIDECGIVKVRIEFVEWVQKPEERQLPHAKATGLARSSGSQP